MLMTREMVTKVIEGEWNVTGIACEDNATAGAF